MVAIYLLRHYGNVVVGVKHSGNQYIVWVLAMEVRYKKLVVVVAVYNM